MAKYYPSSINMANAEQLATWLIESLVVSGNYELVDTISGGSGSITSQWRVVKCHGSSNPRGVPHYIAFFHRSDRKYELRYALAETYDLTTKKMFAPAPGTLTSTIPPDLDGRFRAETGYDMWQDPATKISPTTSGSISWQECYCEESKPTDVTLVVTYSGFYFWHTAGEGSYNSDSILCCVMEKLTETSADNIVCGRFSSRYFKAGASAVSYRDDIVAFRWPKVRVASGSNYSVFNPMGNSAFTTLSGSIGTGGDAFWDGRAVAGRISVRAVNFSSASSTGGLLGLFSDILLVHIQGAGTVNSAMRNRDTTEIPRMDNSGETDTYIYASAYSSGPLGVIINLDAPSS